MKCYDQFGALPVKERYYQNEGCAAKGNWNGVRGVQGKDEGCHVLQAKKAHGGSNCCLQLPSRLQSSDTRCKCGVLFLGAQQKEMMIERCSNANDMH